MNPQDAVAVAIVAQSDKLFAIDAQARRQGLDQAGRHALRQQQAPPLLHEIKTRIETAQSTALPASALAKACRYTLALWQKLTRFLEYPELELSNNLAENSMRPVALGRNYVHSRIMRTSNARKLPIRWFDAYFTQTENRGGCA